VERTKKVQHPLWKRTAGSQPLIQVQTGQLTSLPKKKIHILDIINNFIGICATYTSAFESLSTQSVFLFESSEYTDPKVAKSSLDHLKNTDCWTKHYPHLRLQRDYLKYLFTGPKGPLVKGRIESKETRSDLAAEGVIANLTYTTEEDNNSKNDMGKAESVTQSSFSICKS
jgi:hypothetical protein